MNRLNKISFKILFITIGFWAVLSCTKTSSFHTEAEDEINYEEKLSELNVQIQQLPKYCDPAEFMPIYKEAVPLLEANVDTSTQTAGARNSIIQKLMDIGVYGQAIQQSYLALKANELPSVDDSIYHNLMVYGKLVYLFQISGSPDSIYSICDIAVNDSKKHSNPFWLSSAYNNAGFWLHKYGESELAMRYLLLSDSILNALYEIDNSGYYFQGSVKDNIAAIYQDRKEFRKARDIYAYNFNQRYARGNNPNMLRRRLKAGTSLAYAEMQLNNFKQAKKAIDQTELLFKLFEHPDKIRYEIDFLQVKTDYYKLTGNTLKGFAESQRLVVLKDSLNSWDENLKNRTMNLLANFSSSQIENALQQEKEARQLYEEQSKLRLWIIFLTILGAITFAIVLIRFQKQRIKLLETDKMLSIEKLQHEEQKQQLLSLQLENKKKDLTDMALSLQQKQDWAKELHTHIKKINSERGYKRSREFKKLQEEIHSNVYVDKKLELIQQNIDILSHEFFDKLHSRFPNLSKGENKLCSYIKLNLSTAQIAQLQNVDPASVKMSRYRLKKKFNLGTDQKLDVFIQNFDK